MVRSGPSCLAREFVNPFDLYPGGALLLTIFFGALASLTHL